MTDNSDKAHRTLIAFAILGQMFRELHEHKSAILKLMEEKAQKTFNPSSPKPSKADIKKEAKKNYNRIMAELRKP